MIFLIFMSILLIVVLAVDTSQKRSNFLDNGK